MSQFMACGVRSHFSFKQSPFVFPRLDGRDLFSLRASMLKSPKLLPDEKPLGLALAPDAFVLPAPCGIIDDFIDDLFTARFVSDDWERLRSDNLLALCVLDLPVSENELITRDGVLSLNKLLSEESFVEI